MAFKPGFKGVKSANAGGGANSLFSTASEELCSSGTGIMTGTLTFGSTMIVWPSSGEDGFSEGGVAAGGGGSAWGSGDFPSGGLTRRGTAASSAVTAGVGGAGKSAVSTGAILQRK